MDKKAQRQAARDNFITMYCTHQHPDREDVERVIHESQFTDFRNSFAQFWSEAALLHNKRLEVIKIISDYIRGGILLDLGGGSLSRMASVAEECGVQTYVNIDEQQESQVFFPTTGNMDVVYLEGDMLRTISSIRDACAHITVNAINHEIAFDKKHRNDPSHKHQYHQKLAREVIRVLQPDGLVFGINADASQYFQKLGLEPVSLPLLANTGTKGSIFAYTKKRQTWFDHIKEKLLRS